MKIEVHVTAESLADLYRQLKEQVGELETHISVPPPAEPVQWSGVVATAAAMLGEPAPAAEPEKPKRTRKPKEAAAEPVPDLTPDAAATVAEPAGPTEPEASTSAAAAPSSQGSDTAIARWSESGIVVEMTRDDVLNAAREWIASHPEGKDRAAKLIKGMAASLGAGKVSDLPDSDMQAFVDLLHGAA